MSVTREAVLEKLKTVRGPDLEGDIVSLGMVSDIFIADGKVFFSITVPAERARRSSSRCAPPPSAACKRSRASPAPWSR